MAFTMAFFSIFEQSVKNHWKLFLIIEFETIFKQRSVGVFFTKTWDFNEIIWNLTDDVLNWFQWLITFKGMNKKTFYIFYNAVIYFYRKVGNCTVSKNQVGANLKLIQVKTISRFNSAKKSIFSWQSKYWTFLIELNYLLLYVGYLPILIPAREKINFVKLLSRF